MKRKTCKILIAIGVIWLFIFFTLVFLSNYSIQGSYPSTANFLLVNISLGLLVGFPGIVLILIGYTKWHSERETMKE